MQPPAPLRLKDALALLEGEAPVSVRFVKANRRTGEAGAFGLLPAARIGRGKRAATPAEEAALVAAGIAPPERLPVPNPKTPSTTKMPPATSWSCRAAKSSSKWSRYYSTPAATSPI